MRAAPHGSLPGADGLPGASGGLESRRAVEPVAGDGRRLGRIQRCGAIGRRPRRNPCDTRARRACDTTAAVTVSTIEFPHVETIAEPKLPAEHGELINPNPERSAAWAVTIRQDMNRVPFTSNKGDGYALPGVSCG